MATSSDEDGEPGTAVPAEPDSALRRRRWPLWAGAGGLALAVGLGALWLERNRIAGNVIGGELAKAGLHATYRIDSIGPGEQVLRDVVIGDPAHPDLTLARVTARIQYTLGFPRIGSVRVERARLHGVLSGGHVSFGSLDKLIYGPSDRPSKGLPDINLILRDGAARIDGEQGPIAIRAEGRGRLANGFAGTIVVDAPRLAAGDCHFDGAALQGRVSTRSGLVRFVGPARLDGATCTGLRLAGASADLDATLDKDFAGVSSEFSLRAGPLAAGAQRAQLVSADGDMAWRGGVLAGHVAGDASGLTVPGVTLALAGFDATLDSRRGRTEIQGTLDGQGVQPGPGLDATLAGALRSGTGTLLAPMLGRIRDVLARERRGSRLAARFDFRRGAGGGMTLALPEAKVTGGSGAVLAAVSRGAWTSDGRGPARIAGNVAVGGAGLPHITGRVEQDGGSTTARLAMDTWRAGDAALGLPSLVVTRNRAGAIGFAGEMRLTGAIPGGRVEGLAMPIDGNAAPDGSLALLRHCTSARFDSLVLGEMALDRRTLTLCPQRGAPIVRRSAGGALAVAAGAPALDLAGRFGGSPLRLSTGPIGFAWPGALTARGVKLALGPADAPTRLAIETLDAKIGRDLAGSFAGVAAQLAAVPLDLSEGAGRWRYAGKALTIDGASFALTDRNPEKRFERLVARDATLRLANGAIDAKALLREPTSDRAVVLADIHHDLSASTGHANLAVEDLWFDPKLQPATLTQSLRGVVANVSGHVRGTGRIDWNGRNVTSTGRFSSDSLDLAAAFGPVKGAKGTVVFTDLLGLVTAPDQRISVASINPGVEVRDGVLSFALKPGQELAVAGASWPFAGGTLRLEPVSMHFGAHETRRYTLVVEGLDAARFVEQVQLGNLRATGTFDGALPLVFDEAGGRIAGGRLVSRAPGGNVSYVGALTYKNLSPMANFAFDALKSLDYRQMTIGMNGNLAGEIITELRFDGVKQGAGTKKNFITKQLAKLPLRFDVNVRAAFFDLVTNLKSIYDPAFIKDPRTVGLLDAQGRRIAPAGGPVPKAPATDSSREQPRIQPQESEPMR